MFSPALFKKLLSRRPCASWLSFTQETVACEQADLWVTRASDEEQIDQTGRSVGKKCQESALSRLAASPLDFTLAATPRAPVLHSRLLYSNVSLLAS